VTKASKEGREDKEQKMAIRTTWTVGHACGHDQDHDLSNKRPSARASYAKWLATKECSTCWRTERDRCAEKETEAWLAERRAEKSAEIESWERRSRMPGLDGSDKAVPWARQVRYELVVAACDHAQTVGVFDSAFGAELESHARRVTSASWWIDQRHTEAEDIAELVADAAADPAVDTGTENPL